MTAETKFYKYLVHGTPRTWHWQRIETSTAQGVPDVNLYIPEYGEIWLELKIANPSTVLRPQQNAWIKKRQFLGGNAAIVARRKSKFPEKWTDILIWDNGFDTELTKSGRLKITTGPQYTCNLAAFEKVMKKILKPMKKNGN